MNLCKNPEMNNSYLCDAGGKRVLALASDLNPSNKIKTFPAQVTYNILSSFARKVSECNCLVENIDSLKVYSMQKKSLCFIY